MIRLILSNNFLATKWTAATAVATSSEMSVRVLSDILSTLSGDPLEKQINGSSATHEILSLLSCQKIRCLLHNNTLLVHVPIQFTTSNSLSFGIHFNITQGHAVA
jgi:hypothetical protein